MSTDHTISIFLSLAIGFARLQINEYSRSDKKDWKCCFKLNLLGKSVFVKIIFYEHFGRVWTETEVQKKKWTDRLVIANNRLFHLRKKNEIPLTENKWVFIPATYWCAKWINRRGRSKKQKIDLWTDRMKRIFNKRRLWLYVVRRAHATYFNDTVVCKSIKCIASKRRTPYVECTKSNTKDKNVGYVFSEVWD